MKKRAILISTLGAALLCSSCGASENSSATVEELLEAMEKATTCDVTDIAYPDDIRDNESGQISAALCETNGIQMVGSIFEPDHMTDEFIAEVLEGTTPIVSGQNWMVFNGAYTNNTGIDMQVLERIQDQIGGRIQETEPSRPEDNRVRDPHPS